MTEGSCGTCRYWQITEWKNGEEAAFGICRRYPPRVAGQPLNEAEVWAHTYFPETPPEALCGEFADGAA